MKLRSLLLLTALFCFATLSFADTVNGSLTFGGGGANFFDPGNGFVPGGSSNSGGPAVIVPGAFQFQDAVNADSAQFTGTQLIVTDNCLVGSCTSNFNWTMTFSNPNFTGISLVSNALGVTYSFNAGVITIDWAGPNLNGSQTAVFNVTETPEPGSLALLGSGLLGLGGAVRRKLIAR